MNTFQAGLETAASWLKHQDPGLFGKELLEQWALQIMALTPGAVVSLDKIEAAWQDFKENYPDRNGGNPWKPAKEAFLKAVNKRKVDPCDIVAGTRAFAATHPDPKFVPMPATFINQDRFNVEYWRAPTNGGGLYAIQGELDH
jgi:hypothetical protein